MAKIKVKHAFSKQSFYGFHGVGSNEILSGEGASSMCNFRIREDGALVSREGYRQRISLPKAPVRGIWEGILAGSSLCFAVASDTVYRIDLTKTTATACGTLSKGETPVSFVPYGDTLCLLDGKALRVYENGRFIPVEAYAPLYGKMWDPIAKGDVNEPINLLTPRIRIHYYNTIGSTVFHLPFAADTVDSVRVAGNETTDYGFAVGNNYVTIPSAGERVDVDIACTVSLNEAARTHMIAAQAALAVTIGTVGERMLLSGGNGDRCVYCSTPVDAASLADARLDYPNTCNLYFKESDVLFIGGSDDPVSAFCTHHGGVLAFNRSRVWFLWEEKDGSIDSILALKGLGAAHPNAVTRIEQDLVLADKTGVYLLDAPVSHPEALSARRISPSVSKSFPAQLGERASVFYHRAAKELWLFDPTDTAGVVWVRSVGGEEWYCFRSIFAKAIIDTLDGVTFATENALCTFSAALGTDNGQPILCEYQSNYLDFGVPETPRRSLRVCVCADLGDAVGTLELVSDAGTRTLRLCGSVGDAPDGFDKRIALRRHRFLRYTFRVTSEHPVSLLKVSFFTNV